MRLLFKSFAAAAFFLFIAVSSNAQTTVDATSENVSSKQCDVKKCDPALCDLMVKSGLCTKEQAEACKAKCASKTTKVAAASVERPAIKSVSSKGDSKKASCIKTCAKTCTAKQKAKAE
ncbi:MAG: hypothetical protein P1U56_03325 [Saprospiraceae bacterium]|nr:hypothetical protein [Saprospiraceae bacterium]